MPSKILYDTRTLEILKCQPKPHGLALPSFNGLCKSARVPEEEKKYMAEIVVEEEYLTSIARQYLQIVRRSDDSRIEVIKKLPENPSQQKEKEATTEHKTEEKVKQIKEEFITALLNNDTKKIDELRARYKQMNDEI